MGFPKWLKKTGKVAGEIGLEVGKVAGQAALQSATTHPAIGVAVQLATAFSNNEQGVTAEQIKVLNTILMPRGWCVVALPPKE